MSNPKATIEMASGAKIVVELLPEVAPNTVNNFIHLAQQGFYDGLIFHRVIPNFMIQGGDPDGNGTGGPGYSIPGEFSDNGFDNPLQHEKGVISMARSQMPDSAGSQFFITVAGTPFLDRQYAAFGRVISGQEEADRISNVPRNGMDLPDEEEKIVKITIDTAGKDYPEPKKA